MPYTAIRRAAGFLLMLSCAMGQVDAGATTNAHVKSLYSSLDAHDCKEVPDKADIGVNDLTDEDCRGVAGYHLQIIPVESGRSSVNIVSPAKQVFPLDYSNIVTRSMDGMDAKAEWRVRKQNGKIVPIALIVHLLAHEDMDDPGKVTKKYWVVAKIAATETCVTDSIEEGTKTPVEVRALADSAASRPCAAPLPDAAE